MGFSAGHKMTGGRVTGRLIAYLKDIEPDGGTIPTCDLIICRKYPKLYSQTIENSNGKTTAQTTTLTCAEEETARQDWERRNESRMEKVSERRQRGAKQRATNNVLDCSEVLFCSCLQYLTQYSHSPHFARLR